MKNWERDLESELSFSFCLNDNSDELLVDKLTTFEARFVYEKIKDADDDVFSRSRDMKIAFDVSKTQFDLL